MKNVTHLNTDFPQSTVLGSDQRSKFDRRQNR